MSDEECEVFWGVFIIYGIFELSGYSSVFRKKFRELWRFFLL